jgi:hypothetical protein
MTTFKRNGRRAVVAILAVLVVACCGCVEHSTSGEIHTFYNALWASAACLGAGLVGTVGGWYLRPFSERFGWGLMIAGVLALLGGTPTLFFEKTTVSNEGFFVRSGLCGMSSYDVKFDNTANMQYVMEVTRSRRGGRNTHFYLICQPKAGDQQKVPISGVCKDAFDLIRTRAAEHNIPYQDSTGVGF